MSSGVSNPKAVFMTGPAGAGKTYILNQLGLDNYTQINVDDTYEKLLKQEIGKLSLTDMSPEELSKASSAMVKARTITKEKEEETKKSLKNLAIDATGASSKTLLQRKQSLEDAGYETFMVALYVSPMTSLERNANRERNLPVSAVLTTWAGVNKNLDKYRNEFGDNFVLINNNPENADTSYDIEKIKSIFPSPKGKPKSEKEQAKSDKRKEKINNDIKSLINVERKFDSLETAKDKLKSFTMIKEQKSKTIALYPGKFKPPHKGHFNVVKQALKENDIDSINVIISNKEIDGITAEDSKLIWELYNTKLDNKLNIIISDGSPVSYVLNLIKSSPEQNYFLISGKAEGDRFNYVKDKTNITAKDFGLKIPVNARDIRANIFIKDYLFDNLPSELSVEEKEYVRNILIKRPLKEIGDAGSKPYNYTLESQKSDSLLYSFTTDKSKLTYVVEINENGIVCDFSPNLFISFSIVKYDDRGEQVLDYDITTNKGELYRIMSTLTKITEEAINKFPETRFLCFLTTDKKVKNSLFSQRDLLYKAFIKKLFPTAKMFKDKQNTTYADITEAKMEKETMFEDKDPKIGTGKKPKGSGRRLYTDEDPSDTVGIKFRTKEDIVDTLNKSSFKNKPHARQSQIINLIHQRVKAAYSNAKDPKTKSRLKRGLDYIEKRKESSKEKTQRLRNQKNENVAPNHDGKSSPFGSGYELLDEEVTQSQLDVIEKYADKLFAKLGIDIEFTKHFLNRLNDKRNGKPISTAELMGIFKRLYQKHGKPLSKIEDDLEAVVKDFNKNINIPFMIDVKNDEIDMIAKTIMRKPNFQTTNPIIALQENATYSKDIDIKNRIDQLTQHMIDKGMNIEPTPALEFVDGDSKNARDFFGKTAYYDPNSQTIVLYTEGRHPKDIVRSYAHEMIHHIQNLEGRLGNITTTNTQEDGKLNDIEAEANLRGTMTFRNWTDSLNEIGDASTSPYKWSEEDDDGMTVEVSFETDSGLLYMVQLQRDVYNDIPILDIEFVAGVMDPDTGGTLSSKVITNKGELFKVMSTIVDITKHYIKNTEAQGITYSPSKKGDETISTNQRNALYKAFLKKQVPGIEFKQNSDYIVALFPGYDNLKEDGKLNDIEAEANLKGTMTFRNWTNGILTEMIDAKDAYTEKGSIQTVIDGKRDIAYIATHADSILTDKNFYSALQLGAESGLKALPITNRTRGHAYIVYKKGNIEAKAKAKRLMDIANKHKGYLADKTPKEAKEIGQLLGYDILDINTYINRKYYGIQSPLNEKKLTKAELQKREEIAKSIEKDQPNIDMGKKMAIATDIAKRVAEGRYDKLVTTLSKIALDVMKKFHDSNSKTSESLFIVGNEEEGVDVISNDLEFEFLITTQMSDDDSYVVDGGANVGFDEDNDEITPLLSLDFTLPNNPDWQEISFDIKDVIRHEIEHLTQDGENVKSGKYMEDDQFLRTMIDSDLLSKADYFKLEKEIDAMLQGLYFKAKKSKRPFIEVIDDYFDKLPITKEDRESILKLWIPRAKQLSLPLEEKRNKKQVGVDAYAAELSRLREEEEDDQPTQKLDIDKVKIYCDMDGVIADFEKKFYEISGGFTPKEYETKYGREAFWDLIDNKNGVRFWVGIPWMPEGKKLWNYISQYNPTLLSAPSLNNESRLGKRLWVKNNLPGVKLTLASARNKPNYAGENKILIDDRKDTIDNWVKQGGIGILFTSTNQAIKDLKKLGL